MTEDVFGRAFRAKMAEFDAFRDLVAHGLAAVGENQKAPDRLRGMLEMYEFMSREFPKLLDRWDRETKRTPATS